MKTGMMLSFLGCAITVTVAVMITLRLSAEVLAVILGVMAGVAASIPTSLIVMWMATRTLTHPARGAESAPTRESAEPKIIVLQQPMAPISQGREFQNLPAQSSFSIPVPGYPTFNAMPVETPRAARQFIIIRGDEMPL
jgi:hypothetical protein